MKNWNIFTYLLLMLVLLGNSNSFANEKNSNYTVRPPQLSVPGGEAGETRRVITQFYNWTLICDENRKLGRGICNVTQAIHDEDGNPIFSWSLVSTQNGQPFMLLRTLPGSDTDIPIQVFVDGSDKPVLIRYTRCSDTVCLAQTPVGPILSKQIEHDKDVRIFYKVKEGEIFSFVAPFKGLNEALTSLQR